MFCGTALYQGLIVAPEFREAAAAIKADRDEEAQRLQLLNEVRKVQVRNEADLLLLQEQNLRLGREKNKTLLRGD